MTVVGNGTPVLGATEDVSRPTQAEPTVMDGLSSSKVTGMDPCRLHTALACDAYQTQSNTTTLLECFR